MNESITRAAGAGNGQEWSPSRLEQLICEMGREPFMRTTLYGAASAERRAAASAAIPLVEIENAGAGRLQRGKRSLQPAPEPVRLAAELELYDQVLLMAACN